MTTGADIVAEARSCIGTPFRHQGRTKGLALDCLGLLGHVATVFRLHGHDEWDTEVFRSYGRTPRPDVMVKTLDRLMVRVTTPALGDVLLYAFNVFPQHLAFVSNLKPMRVIHAYPLESLWAVTENGAGFAKIMRAYRFRELV